MFLKSLFLLSTLTVSLCAINNEDRYNRNKKQPTEQEIITENRIRSVNDTPTQDPLLDFTHDLTTDTHLDTTPHTPLGSICIEISEYCNYFINHCINNSSPLNKQKEALEVFCNVLKLLTNLADTDCAIIRLDSYITNIIEIIEALETASNNDETISNYRDEYPLITALQNSPSEPSETRTIIHLALRSPSTATPLIKELFTELQNYTHQKLSMVLSRFKEDTQQLLTISQSNDSLKPVESLFSPEEKKNMESLGWLCRHAANTCVDLSTTVQTSALMAHTGTLMSQISQMLSTMALTYNHLGTNQVRSQDKNSLAALYASMIEHFGQLEPQRASQSLLAHAITLPTMHERELFITSLFSAPRESELFLNQFFPAFSDALAYNLNQFCFTLTTQVTETFRTRYWLC